MWLLLDLEDLDTAAGSFDLRSGAFGDAVDADLEGFIDIAAPEDYDRKRGLAQQAGFVEGLGGNLGICLETFKLVKIYFVVVLPEWRGKTTLERQTAVERQVAAFTVK